MGKIVTMEITKNDADGNLITNIPGIDRLKSYSNQDIYGALRSISDIVPLAYAEDHNNEKLEMLAAYPNEFVVTEAGGSQYPVQQFTKTITYQIVRREPGTLGDAPFQMKKELKPRFREMQAKPNEDGAVEIRGQWFDNLVQFDCWTRSNTEADELIEWFEEFMILYTFFFKGYAGIQEMLYYRGGRFTFGTTEDEAMVRWRNPYKVRSCTYYFRTEKLWLLDYNLIKKIIARLEIQGR